MSGGWFRSNDQAASYIVHEGRCPRKGRARAWSMVDGWSASEVLARIGEIPWLRLCEQCANRLSLDPDDPARFSENDAQPA